MTLVLIGRLAFFLEGWPSKSRDYFWALGKYILFVPWIRDPWGLPLFSLLGASGLRLEVMVLVGLPENRKQKDCRIEIGKMGWERSCVNVGLKYEQ